MAGAYFTGFSKEDFTQVPSSVVADARDSISRGVEHRADILRRNIRRILPAGPGMRLPLIPNVESRDGTSNKDARMTNALKESDNGVDYAGVRPAITQVADTTGNGNGMFFLDTLITIFGTAALYSESLTSISAVDDGMYDFVKGE